MSAFGKRSGASGGRPSFGVAKPMNGSGGSSSPAPAIPEGGDQFPPIEEITDALDAPVSDTGLTPMGAMDRLTARQNASGEAGSSKSEGFEASVHRIKEQVLPRLLERVDPEAAATLSKDARAPVAAA